MSSSTLPKGAKSLLVLGAGRVGGVIASDLAREPGFALRVADASAEALERVRALCQGRAEVQRADLSDAQVVARLAAQADVVVGALPSRFGLAALRAVIETRRPYVDISFMAEDPFALDSLARERGVPAVVDFGVAPGMSHLLAAEGARRLGGDVRRMRILVGGLPRERTIGRAHV